MFSGVRTKEHTEAIKNDKRYGYCADDVTTISDLFAAADQSLFKRVLTNELHVLQRDT